MTNVCKSCGEIVTPGPDGSPCPNCGSMAGYTVSSTFTFRHKIKDGISKYDKQIERLKKFQEIYKGTKVEENLEVKIKNLKKVIKDLENLSLKKPDEEITLSDGFKGSDEVIVEKFIVKKEPETKTKPFTIHTILVKDEADSKIKEGDKEVETSNNAIFEELKIIRQENIKLLENTKPKSKSRHFVEYLLVFFLGAVASYVGTYFYTLGNVGS